MISASTVAAAVCQNHDRIYALDSPDPPSVAMGRGTEAAVVGEKATALLNTGKHAVMLVSMSFEIELVTCCKVLSSIESSMERTV